MDPWIIGGTKSSGKKPERWGQMDIWCCPKKTWTSHLYSGGRRTGMEMSCGAAVGVQGRTLPVAKKADPEQLRGELTYQPYTALQPEAVTPPISVQPAVLVTTGENSGTLDTDPSASKMDLQASDPETVVESPTTPGSPRAPAKEYPKWDKCPPDRYTPSV